MNENSAHGSNISLQDLRRAPQGMGVDVRGLEKDTSSHSRQSARNRYESNSTRVSRLPTPDVSEHGRPPSLHSDGQDFSTHGWSQHPEMSEITGEDTATTHAQTRILQHTVQICTKNAIKPHATRILHPSYVGRNSCCRQEVFGERDVWRSFQGEIQGTDHCDQVPDWPGGGRRQRA